MCVLDYGLMCIGGNRQVVNHESPLSSDKKNKTKQKKRKHERIDGAIRYYSRLHNARAAVGCENSENDCDARTHFRRTPKDGLCQSPSTSPLKKGNFLRKRTKNLSTSLFPLLFGTSKKSVIECRKANTDCNRFGAATTSPLIV